MNKRMFELGSHRSVIREIFEYGKMRKSQIGEENVFDFSLGNPSVPAPFEVNEELLRQIRENGNTFLHGYTSAPGDIKVRVAIAEYINQKYDVNEKADNIYITCGAAAALTSTLGAILNSGDEVIVFAPFFPEYKVFIENASGTVIICKSDKDCLPDINSLKEKISERTRAVIINSPNNPTGAVIDEKRLTQIAEALEEKSKETGNTIYLISDEPYRDLVYDKETKVPFVTKYYDNSIICYSFSKSLSLAGERIGYILVSSKCENDKELFFSICGSARSYGYVCAPSLFQYMIPSVLGKTSDIGVYKENRDILNEALTSYGYETIKPEGAFYLFVKALEDDAVSFAERAKKYELLLVPSDSFGVCGYVRISYCVSTEMIKKSLPAFKKLYEEYMEK